MGHTSGTKYCGRRTRGVYCFCSPNSLADEAIQANTDQLILGVVYAKKTRVEAYKKSSSGF